MEPSPDQQLPPVEQSTLEQLFHLFQKFMKLPMGIKIVLILIVGLLFTGATAKLVALNHVPAQSSNNNSSSSNGGVSLQTNPSSPGGSTNQPNQPTTNKNNPKSVTQTTPTNTQSSSGSTTHPSTSNSGSSGKKSNSGGSGGTQSGGGGSTPSVQLAIPTYWWPPASYDSQLTSAGSHVGFVIANINSGDGITSTQSNFATMINNERAAGIKVYGYVYTQYGSRAIATVEADVDDWYSYYNLDGILFDEAPGTGWTNAEKTYYQTLYNYVKAKSGTYVHGKTVVLNPGTETDQYAMSVSDVISDYEDVESNYAGASVPSWQSQYPANRFWNIVYDSQGITQMKADIALAKARNVGYVYITTATGGNPYDNLPADPFWTDELDDL